MRCWRCGTKTEGNVITCSNCGASLVRPDTHSEKGLALRQTFEDSGTEKTFGDSRRFLEKLNEIRPDSEEFSKWLRPVLDDSSVCDLYKDQITRHGVPDEGFYEEVSDTLKKNLNFDDERTEETIRLLDDMIGWTDSEYGHTSANRNDLPEGEEAEERESGAKKGKLSSKIPWIMGIAATLAVLLISGAVFWGVNNGKTSKAAADDGIIYFVLNDDTPVYLSRNLNSDIIIYLNAGDEVIVLEQGNVFSYVMINNSEYGYIPNRFLALEMLQPDDISDDEETEPSVNVSEMIDTLDDSLAEAGAFSGEITVSMLWNSEDDLDLHIITPSEDEICYYNPRAGGGYLDIDANTYSTMMDDPIENVYFALPMNGRYTIIVDCYEDRSSFDTEYLVRVTIGEKVKTFTGIINSDESIEILNFQYEDDVELNEEIVERALSDTGAVIGDITISVVWDSDDDLDLKVITPSDNELYYGNTSIDGGILDINDYYDWALPLESAYFISPTPGEYRVVLSDFSDNSYYADTNYIVRIAVGDEISTYYGIINGDSPDVEVAVFDYLT